MLGEFANNLAAGHKYAQNQLLLHITNNQHFTRITYQRSGNFLSFLVEYHCFKRPIYMPLTCNKMQINGQKDGFNEEKARFLV